jgi:hypothetical protein
LFTAIGFPPGGSGQYTGTKIGKKQLYTNREKLHKTIQEQRIHKIENTYKSRTQTPKEY